MHARKRYHEWILSIISDYPDLALQAQRLCLRVRSGLHLLGDPSGSQVVRCGRRASWVTMVRRVRHCGAERRTRAPEGRSTGYVGMGSYPFAVSASAQHMVVVRSSLAVRHQRHGPRTTLGRPCRYSIADPAR